MHIIPGPNYFIYTHHTCFACTICQNIVLQCIHRRRTGANIPNTFLACSINKKKTTKTLLSIFTTTLDDVYVVNFKIKLLLSTFDALNSYVNQCPMQVYYPLNGLQKKKTPVSGASRRLVSSA